MSLRSHCRRMTCRFVVCVPVTRCFDNYFWCFVAGVGCDWSLKVYRLYLSTVVEFEAHCWVDGGTGPREIPTSHNFYVFTIEFIFDNPNESKKTYHGVMQQLSAYMFGNAWHNTKPNTRLTPTMQRNRTKQHKPKGHETKRNQTHHQTKSKWPRFLAQSGIKQRRHCQKMHRNPIEPNNTTKIKKTRSAKLLSSDPGNCTFPYHSIPEMHEQTSPFETNLSLW